MQTSDNLDKLAVDLAKAQKEMAGSVLDSDNPFFKSKYSSLTSVWRACKEALHNNGFSIVQSPINEDGRIGVETVLLHKSGQYLRDKFTLAVKRANDPQAEGSSITYARRYTLAAFVGVCPVDDDAEGAMARGSQPKTYDYFVKIFDKAKSKAELKSAWKDNAVEIDRMDKLNKDKLTSYCKQLSETLDFVDCPNGNGSVHVAYCNEECKSRQGCPVYEK